MSFFHKFRTLFRRPQLERDLAEELRTHLEMRAAEYRAEGMEPDEAQKAARRQFGGADQIKETVRDQRSFAWFAHLAQDLRHALGSLRRNPLFAFTTVGTLALGLGATSAIFTIVDAMMWRPLPYAEPGRLVYAPLAFNGQTLRDWQEQQGVLDRIEVQTPFSAVLTGGAEPRQISGEAVSLGMFSLLGRVPLLGRPFVAEEATAGNNQVVLLSHQFWLGHFGGDPRAVGQTLLLDDRPYVVIGVMPRDFMFPRPGMDFWTPLVRATSEAGLRQRLELVGRLRAGFDLATAQAAVQLLNQQLNQSHPQPREWSVNLLALDRARANPGPRRMLLVVLGAVGFVLLIACVNVANLLFVRALVRQREFAVRTALGAGGGRLIRQVLTESLVLVAGGTGGGLLLAQWAVQAIWRRMPGEVNFLTLNRVHLDWRVFLFTGALAGLATVLCGLVPALQAARSDPQRALGTTARTGTGSRQQRRWQQGFVVAQSALAFVLLVGAGLLMRGFVRLSAVDPGFETRNLAALSLELPASRYPSEASRRSFFAQLRERLTALPGVADVALAAAIPPRTSGFSSLSAVEAEGRAPESLGRELLPYNTVGDDYFRVMRIPLLRGRNFGEQDAAGGPVAIIVNDRFARRFWPDGDPLGRRLRLAPNQPWMTVVGVVGDVKAMSLDDEDGSLEYYRAIRQDGVGRYATLAIRTTIEPRLLMPSIRGEVVGLDSRLPISRLATAGDLMADTLAVTRFSLGLMSVFAGLAILLATLGLYGVMAYTVAQRTSEIGVRIALGGTSGQIALFVARRGLALLGTGLLAGGLAAAMLTRFLRTLLFEISPLDPTTFAGVAAILGLAGACACWLPARRAARMDPVVALRAE